MRTMEVESVAVRADGTGESSLVLVEVGRDRAVASATRWLGLVMMPHSRAMAWAVRAKSPVTWGCEGQAWEGGLGMTDHEDADAGPAESAHDSGDLLARRVDDGDETDEGQAGARLLHHLCFEAGGRGR